MGLTDSQKQAIRTIDKNVAVNAGAGSGKTSVLVNRYVYILENGKLEEGKEIDSILAITFTKKAAAEMKERIRKSIIEKSMEDKKWKKIYYDMDKAHISTIHSFCSKILRENPVESNIDPNFRVMEDYEAAKLLLEVIQGYIDEEIDKNINIQEFFRYFTASIYDGIAYEIKNLYGKIRSTGIEFSKVKDMTLNTIDNIKVDTELVEEIKGIFAELISKARGNSKIRRLKDDEQWLQFKESSSYNEDYLIGTLEYLYDFIGSTKTDELKQQLASNIKKVLKIKEKQKRHIYEILLDILIEIDKRYTEEKGKLGVMDYEDLQLRVLKLFDNSAIRKKYQEKFRYIMIDEFQDTNELQKMIVYKLCSSKSALDRGNLFVVGDPKQSIYRFRGADVDVFFDVIEDIKRVSGIEPISLKVNFRTVNTVMDFVNQLFKRLMGDRYEELVPHKKSTNEIDVEILEDEELEVPQGEAPAEYLRRFESELLAKRIKELVNSGQYDYKDIAILFRATTDNDIYEQALKEYGIPFYNVDGKGFYNTQEIKDIINGLKVIDNKFDNLALAGALRSPMFGLSDKTLYWLFRYYRSNPLEGLKEGIPNVSDIENKKSKEAYEILSKLNRIKSFVKVYDLISELIDRTYYVETWMLRFGNKQAAANIFKLIEVAREFSLRETGDLEGFLRYIEDKIKIELEESQAQVESQDGNTVKIMTIHKSKGLQFKVVILPQMAKQFNLSNPNIIFDKRLGIAIKHPDSQGNLSKDVSYIYSDIVDEIKEKDEEEHKRVLYVAMTRCEERLIVCNQGTGKERESFRKMIIEHLQHCDKFVKIKNIDIEKEEYKPIVNIVIDDIKNIDANLAISPLIKDFKEYNSKYFNRYTITQYMTFKECKRRFYMTYYKGLPVDDLFEDEDYQRDKGVIDPSVKGQIIHKICENYTNGVDIEKLVKRAVEAHNITPSSIILNELDKYVKNYIQFHRDDYDRIYNEKEFYYNLEDRFIYGVIDRIHIKDNYAEIIDFKTNRVVDKTYLVNKYIPQIQLYTKAFKDIYGIEVKKAGILLLETGDFLDIDITEESLNRNIEEIKEFIKFVEGNHDIKEYEKGNKNCSYCRFKAICE